MNGSMQFKPMLLKFTLYFKIWHVENIPKQLTHFQICWLGQERVIGMEKWGIEEGRMVRENS